MITIDYGKGNSQTVYTLVTNCNLEPKLRKIILISKYMIKRYGIHGAVDRILKIKK